MKLKQFIILGSDDCDYINIFNLEGTQLLKECSVEKYLKTKKPINGIIKSWYMEVENWDYPVMNIVIE